MVIAPLRQAGKYGARIGWSLAAAAFEQPFYAMTSRNAFRLEGEDHDERVLRFFEGEAEASDTLQRRYTLVRATGRLRSSPCSLSNTRPSSRTICSAKSRLAT